MARSVMADNIRLIVEKQKKFFSSLSSRTYESRRTRLDRFSEMIEKHETDIYEALREDLGKNVSESYLGEILTLKGEISFCKQNLKKWIRGRAVKTPLVYIPGKSRIIPEPYGAALIISPWNYPLQLAFIPAVSALAAGNSAVIKPSEYSVKTSALIKRLVEQYFDCQELAVVEGGPEVVKELLKQNFDYVFYTGGEAGGRAVAEACLKRLTPMTLELGGKSPCIAGKLKNFASAAKRIVWGKFFNAGQTCVAPDFLIAEESVKEPLLRNIEEEIKNFYGDNPKLSEDFARIINDRHFDRLTNLFKGEKIIFGGEVSKGEKYISPTVVDGVDWDSPLMREEIFGPVLPVLTYSDEDDMISRINFRPKPLALYVFSEDKRFCDKILRSVSSGGACVNDTLIHITTPYLPFGGVGASGIGRYRGKFGFDIFSHEKSVMERPLGLDVDLRFPPYGNFSALIKRVFEFLSS